MPEAWIDSKPWRPGYSLMTRRKFIVSAVTTCLCLCGLHRETNADSSQHRPQNHRHPEQRIKALFSDTENARAVGLGYLATHADMAFDAVNRVENFFASALSEQEWLTRQRREDFTQGRTVTVDGWVLARCEADLCAALVLLTRDH
jgi:hypothetical protein